jgi:hypothetical protein
MYIESYEIRQGPMECRIAWLRAAFERQICEGHFINRAGVSDQCVLQLKRGHPSQLSRKDRGGRGEDKLRMADVLSLCVYVRHLGRIQGRIRRNAVYGYAALCPWCLFRHRWHHVFSGCKNRRLPPWPGMVGHCGFPDWIFSGTRTSPLSSSC